jgi:hypothetical protein
VSSQIAVAQHQKARSEPLAPAIAERRQETYTSTGVRAPWVTEQQTAPAKANREYRARPVGAVGSMWAATLAFAASSLAEPVLVGGAEVAISLACNGSDKGLSGEWWWW